MAAPALPAVSSMPRAEYDRVNRVNWSTLKHMARSPAHYHHRLTAKHEDTDAMKRGRVTHLAVFEPERYREETIVWDCGARKGKDWEQFVARNRGLEILTEGMHEAALAIAKAARADAVAAPYLTGGKGEQTLLWTYVELPLGATPGFSVECKGRVDFIANLGAIVDLKTCADASPDAFGRQVANLDYHAQAALYVDGYRAATGVQLPYVVVAVEAVEPYVVQVYRVPDDVLALGRERYRALLSRLQMCRETSTWPGYAGAPLDLALPPWMQPREDVVEEVSPA